MGSKKADGRAQIEKGWHFYNTSDFLLLDQAQNFLNDPHIVQQEIIKAYWKQVDIEI